MASSVGKIKEAIKIGAGEHWVDKYERNNSQREQDAEDLGMTIAAWADWDGILIFKTFISALEDANFHTECEVIKNMLENILTRK